jgi:hypothetical protein
MTKKRILLSDLKIAEDGSFVISEDFDELSPGSHYKSRGSGSDNYTCNNTNDCNGSANFTSCTNSSSCDNTINWTSCSTDKPK